MRVLIGGRQLFFLKDDLLLPTFFFWCPKFLLLLINLKLRNFER